MDIGDRVNYAIGVVVLSFIGIILLPYMYDGVTDMEESTHNETYINETGEEDTRVVDSVPDWIHLILSILIGAGLVVFYINAILYAKENM
ncbi:MAG: hypothetical protein ACOCZ5_01130 [bacterium]